ncbi:class I SAM-dependent methyltransferase [Actinophytocola gossypii]|uniref:Class I SAM-dependent methyltransferase n=1 Tax=Actinophytocola gossypii TaxID=2812003 RepID=A0ABT2J420_9PSEU|nr:class I SAM-dependent methyltransferase [Actinophytocola gossypii]MCT2582587.1 class I SAM-dependent methyltransferase [Actinophytocola gossypii]
MARISYDDQTAAAFKAVREIRRDGLAHWRDAVRRHLGPGPGMTVADIGAGTGAFAAAFADWFGVDVLAVEPSAAMRAWIPARPDIQVFEGHVGDLPLPADSVDGVWLSLVVHHVSDLAAAAREVRRVLRPGAPVLLRQGFSGRVDAVRTFPWEFFPEVARMVTDTCPSVDEVCRAFATAGFRRDALEAVPETLMSPAEFLDQLDAFRRADTNIRRLSEEEFRRGRERLRHATGTEPRTNQLDLLVLR